MRWRVLSQLFPGRDHSRRAGVVSVCCAHPLAIEAALRQGRALGEPLIVEATCNQVNQEGGYTGLEPQGFRRLVEELAARVGFARRDLVLGGDHLGPNPWRHLPAGDAMARAEALVAAFVRAGFTKLHLDTSMACGGEGPLPEELVAGRAARLAQVAEAAASPDAPLSYVVGTEVPVPGGAVEAPDAHHVTSPEAVLRTVELHRQAFDRLGLQAAFGRVVGVVVQPGVEFGSAEVVVYDRARAAPLCAVLPRLPQLSFEAHSTDHQPPAALAALVEDGFALLKIGPMLTFAMREALYALDQVAEALFQVPEAESLRGAMERLMVREPRHWAGYYHGAPEEQRVLRHFGLSDRIRYYWPHPEASAAVERLFRRFEGRAIPGALLSQFLPALHAEVLEGRLPAAPRELVLAAMARAFRPFQAPCAAAPGAP